MVYIIEIIFIVIGLLLLVKGADFLVRAAANIAKLFGLSEMLIGLTIVAIGTSLPEVFITFKAATDGRSDLIIGNAIGSSICNFLFVIGISSMVRRVKVDRRIITRHIPIGLVAMVLLLILGNTGIINGQATISRWNGIILLIFTIIYIIYTIYEERQSKKKREENINEIEEMDEEDEEEAKHQVKEEKSIWKILLYMVLGIIGLKAGSDFVVDNAVLITEAMGVSEKVISMTVIAFGTALPEIVTSITASYRGESDLILGNVTGSNILNVCLLIGLGSVINPLSFSFEFNSTIIVLMISTIIISLIATMNKDNYIRRRQGLVLVFVYIIYIYQYVSMN